MRRVLPLTVISYLTYNILVFTGQDSATFSVNSAHGIHDTMHNLYKAFSDTQMFFYLGTYQTTG